MGMTIDEAEALEILNDIGLNANYMQNRESRTGMACKIAIEAMRKYQKIQEIVSSKTTRLSYEDGFRQIKEVLEDGNE